MIIKSTFSLVASLVLCLGVASTAEIEGPRSCPDAQKLLYVPRERGTRIRPRPPYCSFGRASRTKKIKLPVWRRARPVHSRSSPSYAPLRVGFNLTACH